MTQSLARRVGSGRRTAAGAMLAGLALAGALVVAVPAEAATNHHQGHVHTASNKTDAKRIATSKKFDAKQHTATKRTDAKHNATSKKQHAGSMKHQGPGTTADRATTAKREHPPQKATKAARREHAATLKATSDRSAAKAAHHRTAAGASQLTANRSTVTPPRTVLAQGASWPLTGTDTTTAPVLTGFADQLTPLLSGAKSPAGPVKKAAGKVPAGKLKKAIQKSGQPVAQPTASNPIPTQKPPVPAPTATSGGSASEPATNLAGASVTDNGTMPNQAGPAVVPARPAAAKPTPSSHPSQYRGAPAASRPMGIVFALPHRIAQAGLSVGRIPLALLVIVVMAGLGLVVTGTRRRNSGQG